MKQYIDGGFCVASRNVMLGNMFMFDIKANIGKAPVEVESYFVPMKPAVKKKHRMN